MPQQPSDKQFTDLRPGLITEAGYLNAPEGSTLDEANFRLNIDGSRRRRRGLDVETGVSARLTHETTFEQDHAVTTWKWRNAGGDADKDFIVIQMNRWLYIYDDTGTALGDNFLAKISLLPYNTTGTAADVEDNPVHCASGVGVLIVTGRYIEPFYVEYDSTAGTFSETEIQILERDFHTIPEGGVRFRTEPTTLTDVHKYNLVNRGWAEADITQYFTDKAKYPALGMYWYKGYRRQTATGYADEDGVYTWDSNKMEAHPFSNASAPTGSLLIDPFDTQQGWQSQPGEFPIEDWTVTSPSPESWTPQAGSWTIDITVTGHGLGTHPQTFSVFGQSSRYTMNEGKYTGESPDVDLENVSWSFDGEWTSASIPDLDSVTISVPGNFDGDPTSKPTYWNGWDDQYESYGYIATGDPVANPLPASGGDAYVTTERPTVCGWYAGRAWFAGIKHSQLVDRIYFSKLIRPMNREFGECFQRNDPTDEVFNELLADDGGVIVISDIGNVIHMLDYNGQLLIFSDAGVWEVKGVNDIFKSDNYQVRRVTDNEATSRFSPILVEGTVWFTGTKGIFAIRPEERTGILYAANMSAAKVQAKWNAIPPSRMKRVWTVYDDANKQLYFLYDLSATVFTHLYTKALVYDLRLDGWYLYTFPGSTTECIVGALALKDADDSDSYKKVKFLKFDVSGSYSYLNFCDLEQSDYTDFDGNEQSAYLTMAPDNIGSWAHRRQAPVVHVFCGRVETGVDASGAVTNPGSMTMQARWDFADNVASGEFSSEYQVYRHTRQWVPDSLPQTSFDDGYPVVVTRNKVRGRGKALQLKFTAGEGSDAHLLGYSIRYKISGRV